MSMPLATYENVLLGTPATLNSRDIESLKCAALITEWPKGTYFLGRACSWVLADIQEKQPGPIETKRCPHGNDARHLSALEFQANLVKQLRDGAPRGTLLTTWMEKISQGYRPFDLLRTQLPLYRLEEPQLKKGADPDEFNWDAELQSASHQLVLAGQGTPEDGPTYWTMCWILANSPSGLPMELSTLREMVLTLLDARKVQDERVDAIAAKGFIQTRINSSGSTICSIDFSGRIASIPTESARSLAALPGLIRGKSFWAWPTGEPHEIIESQAMPHHVFTVPLTLAVFLGAHAARLARMQRTTEDNLGISSVILVKERIGRLVVPSAVVNGAKLGVTHFTISDQGSLGVATLRSISDLGAPVPNPEEAPEDVLQFLSETLGLDPGEDENAHISPKSLRAQLRIKGDESTGLSMEINALINQASRALADG
jgi:hypothetical protein